MKAVAAEIDVCDLLRADFPPYRIG